HQCPCSAHVALSLSFINAPAPPDISTLTLHDALPICNPVEPMGEQFPFRKRSSFTDEDEESCLEGILGVVRVMYDASAHAQDHRSEEHTSELQSLTNLVCRLLLETKKPKPLANTSPLA